MLCRERDGEKTRPRRSNSPLKYRRASIDGREPPPPPLIASKSPPPHSFLVLSCSHRRQFLPSRPALLKNQNPILPTGKRHNKTHTLCRRCGRTTFHIQKSTCSSCGYPAARIRKCEWILLAVRSQEGRRCLRAQRAEVGEGDPRRGKELTAARHSHQRDRRRSPLFFFNPDHFQNKNINIKKNRQLGQQGHPPQDHGHGPHAPPQGPPAPRQERLPRGLPGREEDGMKKEKR